jgi:hypothetical protein
VISQVGGPLGLGRPPRRGAAAGAGLGAATGGLGGRRGHPALEVHPDPDSHGQEEERHDGVPGHAAEGASVPRVGAALLGGSAWGG